MGTAHHKAPCARGENAAGRRGEEFIEIFRRMLFRGRGHVTQPTNMRATAKQKGCDRAKAQTGL